MKTSRRSFFTKFTSLFAGVGIVRSHSADEAVTLHCANCGAPCIIKSSTVNGVSRSEAPPTVFYHETKQRYTVCSRHCALTFDPPCGFNGGRATFSGGGV